MRRSSTETLGRIGHIKDRITFLQADLLDQASLTKALEALNEARIFSERTEETWWESERCRLHGDLLLRRAVCAKPLAET